MMTMSAVVTKRTDAKAALAALLADVAETGGEGKDLSGVISNYVDQGTAVKVARNDPENSELQDSEFYDDYEAMHPGAIQALKTALTSAAEVVDSQ